MHRWHRYDSFASTYCVIVRPYSFVFVAIVSCHGLALVTWTNADLFGSFATHFSKTGIKILFIWRKCIGKCRVQKCRQFIQAREKSWVRKIKHKVQLSCAARYICHGHHCNILTTFWKKCKLFIENVGVLKEIASKLIPGTQFTICHH